MTPRVGGGISHGAGKYPILDDGRVELVPLDQATESPRDTALAFIALAFLFALIFFGAFLMAPTSHSHKEAIHHERSSR